MILAAELLILGIILYRKGINPRSLIGTIGSTYNEMCRGGVLLCFTRFALRVSLYASLYISPFLYKRGTGETRVVETRVEQRADEQSYEQSVGVERDV